MKKLELKDLLENEKVINNIKTNTRISNMNDGDVEFLIDLTILSNDKNSISECVDDLCFENTLHKASDEEVYLLESRWFADGMYLNGYLEVFDKDMNIIKIDTDDVWDYKNWEIVKY